MKKHLRLILQHILPLILLGGIVMPIHATELISITGVTLTDLKDGDSFKVNAAGRELHLRLYYVDCLETTANGFLKDRVLKQKDYFALKNVSTVLDFGKQAAEHYPSHSSSTPVMPKRPAHLAIMPSLKPPMAMISVASSLPKD